MQICISRSNTTITNGAWQRELTVSQKVRAVQARTTPVSGTAKFVRDRMFQKDEREFPKS